MTDTTARSLPTPTIVICSVAALVAVVGLFLPSLSPVQSNAAPAAPADGPGADGTAAIQIAGFDYAGDLVVQPGQRIQVTNVDGVPHTLTASDGSFDTGVIDGSGQGSFLAPDEDGVISFICTIHPSMTGELTISS